MQVRLKVDLKVDYTDKCLALETQVGEHWIKNYRKSRPLRLGNDFQMDLQVNLKVDMKVDLAVDYTDKYLALETQNGQHLMNNSRKFR